MQLKRVFKEKNQKIYGIYHVKEIKNFAIKLHNTGLVYPKSMKFTKSDEYTILRLESG